MNPENLMAALAPLREPDAISWWPLAWGWWVILGLLAAIVVWALVWLIRRHQRNRYRREGLKSLKRALDQGDMTLSQLNQLLKIIALQAWPQDAVAELHGTQWIAFLTATNPKIAKAGTNDEGLDQLQDVYRRPEAAVSQHLADAAQGWIAHHRSAHV